MPLALLRFAVAAHDAELAFALVRAIGPAADRELRSLPRLDRSRGDRPLLQAALDLVASA